MTTAARLTIDDAPFVFLGERLWLDFVNTDDMRRGARVDTLRDFSALVGWLEAAGVLDAERAAGMRRRAREQPAGASAPRSASGSGTFLKSRRDTHTSTWCVEACSNVALAFIMSQLMVSDVRPSLLKYVTTRSRSSSRAGA